MLFFNDDERGMQAIEDARLGGIYDTYDEDVRECPVCGGLYPKYFYVNKDDECVGCTICVTEMDFLEGERW